jgi:hypothetical protein
MAAIGIVGTTAGFVVGADGRKQLDDATGATTDANRLARESDSAQKIWVISDAKPGREKALAYAIAGTVFLEPGFDLLNTLKEQIESLANQGFEDCFSYLERLGEEVKAAMNQARQNGKAEAFVEDVKFKQGPAWKIADVFFLGYFMSHPCLMVMHLIHSNQIPDFQLTIFQHPENCRILYGSRIVRDAMYDKQGHPVKNSPFLEYTEERPNDGLNKAQNMVERYIKACSSPEAREMDDSCNGIGGHIHVARITQTVGFRWVLGREPITKEIKHD